jgi:preprotein translocase subunit SecA
MRAEPVKRLVLVALLRKAWMERHNRVEDGRAIQELEFLNQPLDLLPFADMRKMAHDLDISSNPDSPENLDELLEILELSEAEKGRLSAILQAGIQHQVLNARKHTEESQIIAGAGAFGAVTIATNMAGRGVDIKLGGELAEEIIAGVIRVLRRAGHANPYDMKMEEQRQALLAMDPADYGIYEPEVRYFLQHMEDMQRVRDLGGLHVIGSERHESRRIDNQLRGRSARQGDPGSSRFYLSMEDELMRLFGGQQAESLMERLKIDEAMPLEVGLVGRLVEQSQTRVEGANFDVRKHLLEYDDVLNTQRASIYAQRDRIFKKDDLSEDVTEMLRKEVTERVPRALEDEEGPWKLLAWLDQIQPPLSINGFIYPSYTLRLLVDHLLGSQQAGGNGRITAGQDLPVSLSDSGGTLSREGALTALLEVASESLKAEEEHLLRSVDNLLDVTRQRLENQLDERLEAVDTYFESLSLDEEGPERSPRQITEELTNLLQLPVKLSPEEQRALREDPEEVAENLRAQVATLLFEQAVTRLIGAVERRFEEDVSVDRERLDGDDWDTLADLVLDSVQDAFVKRRQRLVGEDRDGLIAKDLEQGLAKFPESLSAMHLIHLLLQIPQGTQATFDRRTHRRVVTRTTRLTYTYAAAHLLDQRDPEEVAADVLKHLERAQAALRYAWGRNEWSRLASARLLDLDETTQKGLRNLLGEGRFQAMGEGPLQAFEGEERTQLVDELGRQALTEIYRQLLLGVISELWVEYLTSMEALRVSIGLEAYAQRDPLVQYKNRAFEMFQELLSNMRLGVVNRMFTYRPRDLSSIQTTVSRIEAPEPKPEPVDVKGNAPVKSKENAPGKGKRRRRRR